MIDSMLTFVDPQTNSTEVRIPCFDLVRGQLIARDGHVVAATPQGPTILSCAQGWLTLSLDEAVALKNAGVVYTASVPYLGGSTQGKVLVLDAAAATLYGLEATGFNRVVNGVATFISGAIALTANAFEAIEDHESGVLADEKLTLTAERSTPITAMHLKDAMDWVKLSGPVQESKTVRRAGGLQETFTVNTFPQGSVVSGVAISDPYATIGSGAQKANPVATQAPANRYGNTFSGFARRS